MHPVEQKNAELAIEAEMDPAGDVARTIAAVEADLDKAAEQLDLMSFERGLLLRSLGKARAAMNLAMVDEATPLGRLARITVARNVIDQLTRTMNQRGAVAAGGMLSVASTRLDALAARMRQREEVARGQGTGSSDDASGEAA